jgi:hypothetical protein
MTKRITSRGVAGIAVGAMLMGAVPLFAQQPAPPAPTGPAVGEMAPDFTLGGATRYGVLKDPVTLSALRGNTVVIAFFFKARTKG